MAGIDAILAAYRQRESGNQNIPNRMGPGGTPLSSASGYYQMIDPTWLEGARMAGVDTAQYPRAISAPFELQDKAARALYARYGGKPWTSSEGVSVGGKLSEAVMPTPPIPPEGAAPSPVAVSAPDAQPATSTVNPALIALAMGQTGVAGGPGSLGQAFAQAAQAGQQQNQQTQPSGLRSLLSGFS